MKTMRSLKMKVTKVEVSSLTSKDIQTMYDIYSKAYDQTDLETFNCDLSQKQFSFIGRDTGSGEIVGFSTMEIKNFEYQNRKMTYFFSGDTMISKEYWGQKSLHIAFAKNALLFKLKNPTRQVYWYLICMGYRTYMIMAKNCPNHFPRFDKPTPSFHKGIIDYISTSRYGSQYDQVNGVIIPDKPTTLSHHVAPINQSVMHVPQIRFLATKNPGYDQGHEMACIAELDFYMLTYWLKRTLNQLLAKLVFSNVKEVQQKLKQMEGDELKNLDSK